MPEAELRRRLVGVRRIGRQVAWHDQVDSTNDLAHQEAHEPDRDGLVILADFQSGGRGQYGRAWSAPARSSLLFSILLFPPDRLAQPSFLTAWSALSIVEVLRGIFRLDARVKWPNDVLIDGRKVCGILVERRMGTVVGIGLNVSILPEEFPADLRMPATSLEIERTRLAGNAAGSETLSPVDRVQLAADLIATLDASYLEALESGPDPIYDRWTATMTPMVGDRVTATTRRESIEGMLLDLRPDRGARIRRPGGVIAHVPSTELLRVERRVG